MNTIMNTSRGSHALRAAQRSIAEQTYTRIISCLGDHPCVSFALSCCGFVHWSPELDVAVKLMQVVNYGDPTSADRLICDLHPSWITPERVELEQKL
ncbi:MAG: hypothetical protein JWP89_6924 [Schlesneria sp.]|nr:hypothetical protein [Schlesneria sp.]